MAVTGVEGHEHVGGECFDADLDGLDDALDRRPTKVSGAVVPLIPSR